MSDEHDPAHDRELEATLEVVGPPRARPEFEAALRERFLSAADAGEHEPSTPASDAVPRPAARSATRFRLLLSGLATAAAIIVVIARMTPKQPAAWTVMSGEGTVVVDGQRIDARDTQRLADALRSAKTIETLEHALRIELRDELVLDLDPRTRLEGVRFPAVAPYALTVLAGGLHVATTAVFHGRNLRVATADLEVDSIGTVFGIDLVSGGTCLCCLEGAVAVAPRAASTGGARPETIPGPGSSFAGHGTGTLKKGELVQDHARVLHELREWLRQSGAR